MKTETKPRAPRMTAQERRDEVLDAAVAEFAAYGLHGASTEQIAERAGISQPYIFRLFGTKKELFIAAAERVCDRIVETFGEAVAGDPDNALHAMGQSFMELLSRREEFLMLLQAYAAAADRDVQEDMRRRLGDMYYRVERASGASAQELQTFFSYGMLLMITTALDVPALMDREQWARQLLAEKEFGPCSSS